MHLSIVNVRTFLTKSDFKRAFCAPPPNHDAQCVDHMGLSIGKNSLKLVASLIVTVLLALAIRQQYEPKLHTLREREFNLVPGARPIPIKALMDSMKGKTRQKASQRKLHFNQRNELELVSLVNRVDDSLVDLSFFLTPDSKKVLSQRSLDQLVSVVIRPSWNVLMYTIFCELHASLQSGPPACGSGTSLEAYSNFMTIGLPPGANRVRDLGYVRASVAALAWRQDSHAVLEQGFFRTTSATLLPQWMCTGDDSHWATTTRSSWSVIGDLNFDIGVEATIDAAKWSHRISQSLGTSFALDVHQSSPTPASWLSLERTLLQRVRVWHPLATPLSNMALLQAAFRPGVACISITTRGGLLMALLQHRLWGYQCDDFVILFSTPGGSKGENIVYSAEELAAIEASGVHRHHLAPLELVYNYTNVPQVNLGWQRMVEVMEWIEYWPESHRYSHFYFVNEDVFALPENLYALLSKPEYYGLNAAGKPLFLGNRMIADTSSYNPALDSYTHRRVPFIHTGAGFVLNQPARKLLYFALQGGHCGDNILTSNIDLLLAECLGLHAKVPPMDTADELGEDRFHPLPLQKLIQTVRADSPTDLSWYATQKPKSLSPHFKKDPIRLVSSTSIAFGAVSTPERAIWLYRALYQK